MFTCVQLLKKLNFIQTVNKAWTRRLFLKYTYPDLLHAKRVDVEVRRRFDDEQELQSGVEDELPQRETEPHPEVAEETVLAVQSEVSEGW